MSTPTVGFVVKIVKPHVPMIKFPNRTVPRNGVPLKHTTSTNASKSQDSIATTSNTTSIDFKDLPAKYRRRSISQSEIEAIESGGSR